MAKEITFKIVADANQAASEAKSLKQQLREATKEAQNLIAAGKENTDAYRKARNEVARLQDKLRDFNDELKALDPGAKFQAIAGVASSLAGGFQAAQGAMALFGAESKEVEKALLKVQAATALAQGIDQVREIGKAFGLAKTAILGGVQSLGKMRVALISTGIGAIAVAVGTLAANWESVKEWVDKTIPSLGGVSNMFDNIKKVAMGTLAAIIENFKVFGEVVGNLFRGNFDKAAEAANSFGKRVSEAYTKGFIEEEKKQANEREAALLESQVKTHNRQLKLMEAQGKETYAFRKQIFEEQLKLLELQKGKESDEYKDMYVELQLLEIEHNKKIQEEKKRHADWLKEHRQQAMLDQQQAQADLISIADQWLVEIAKQDEARLKEEEETNKSIAESSKMLAQAEIKAEMDAIQAKIDAYNQEQAIQQAKFQMATDSVNLISNLGNLLIQDQKKLEAFNKKAALIQIGIDTAKALSSALATTNAPTVDNVASGGLAGIAKYIALAGTITANALRAKQILQSNGSSGSAPSLGGSVSLPKLSGVPSTAAPNVGDVTNVGSQRVSNQSGQGADSGGQFKIYVTETDISDTQKRVGTIKQKAKVF